MNKLEKICHFWYQKKLLNKIQHNHKFNKYVFNHFIKETSLAYLKNNINEKKLDNIISKHYEKQRKYFNSKLQRFSNSKKLKEYNLSHQQKKALLFAYISGLIKLNNKDISTLLSVIEISNKEQL